MHLFQFHLFRVGVPLMILVSCCKDYVDICNVYKSWIGVMIVYYYIRSYWDRRRYVLVNMFVAAILVVVSLFGAGLIDAIANDEIVAVSVTPLLSLSWITFFFYSHRFDLTELDTFLYMNLRARTFRKVSAIFLLQCLILTYLSNLRFFLGKSLIAKLHKIVLLLIVSSNAYLAAEIHSDVHLSSYFAKAFSTLRQKVLPFFLTNVSIYCILFQKKHIDYVDEYRTINDITDIVFMCTDFKCIMSFAWKECIFSLRYEAKKYRSILTHYYNTGQFLMYCLSVSVSAGIFIWLCSYAITLVNTHFDPETQITFVDVDTISTPYANHENENLYERHMNEDVTFHCNLYVSPDMKYARVMWIHNGTILRLNGSERIQVNENLSEISILLIDHMDYGEYQCVVEYLIYEYEPHIVKGVLIHRLIERKIHRSSLINRLKPPNLFKEYNHVDIGGLVWFKFDFYISLAEEEDISFKYTVNGEDVYDICSPDITSCNLTSYIIKRTYQSYFQNRSEAYRLTAGMFSKHVIELETCFCSSMYGLHEIVIYRHFFNKTTQKNTVMEIIYPVKYYFYPTDYDTVINDKLYESSVPNELIRSILKASDELVIPSFLWFSKRKVNISFLINSIFTFVCYCLFALCVRFCNSVINLYCQVTIAPFRNRILFGSFTIPRSPIIKNTPLAGIEGIDDFHFDVYLSSSEEDDITAMSVVTFLETDCRLRVCVPARDLVHEGNISYFTSFSRATEQCRKFIVILSNHYIEDDMCNNVQLISCIIPLIHSTRRQGRDLIFLKLDRDVEIPVQIMFDSDVTIINYTTDDDDIEARRKLRRLLLNNQFNYFDPFS